MNNVTTTRDDECDCQCPHAEEQEGATSRDVVELRFLTNPFGGWIEPVARAFEEHKQGVVKIEFVQVPFPQLFPDIINEAKSKIGLYHGFVTPPSVAGSVVEHQGWSDLLPFIQESAENLADWTDIMLGYRQQVAQYQDQIIMYPLDGDVLSLFYRRDIFEHFKLTVPRTWDEYVQVAKATHGKVFEGKELIGSCVGRLNNCAGAYWANLHLSALTQTDGTSTGHIFDTKDMTPLAGPALEQTLEWMVQEVKYGPPSQFDYCVEDPSFFAMSTGECVMNYNWGNTFKTAFEPNSKLHGDKLGIALTPGSTRVLDRATMKLVPCDQERCKHGEYHEDIGWVNRAPYLAFGGWACAVSNYTSSVHKRLATEFCAFAASREQTTKAIIPKATDTAPKSGQDPFRTSHLEVEHYINQGYERQATEMYIESIKSGIESKNVVTDIRFPSSNDIYGVLDNEFHDFLNKTTQNVFSSVDLDKKIHETVKGITQQWHTILTEHDQDAQAPALVTYQRLRGVYSNDIELNHLDGFRIFGAILCCLVVFCSLLFGAWTFFARKSFVVRAAQQVMLQLICLGALITAGTIIPFGLDDGILSEEGAGKACATIPWFLILGWSLLSSALGAKLYRVNTVYRHAMEFRRVEVSLRDVFLPMGLLTASNVALLSVWDISEPPVWVREEINEFESIGKCCYGTETVAAKICLSLIAVLNGATLLYTNYQAYLARHIAKEYGESEYIAMAFGSILQIVVVSVPLLIIVEDNPKATYFLQCTVVFVACMSILLLMFVPKMYSWTKDLGDSNSIQGDSSDDMDGSSHEDRARYMQDTWGKEESFGSRLDLASHRKHRLHSSSWERRVPDLTTTSIPEDAVFDSPDCSIEESAVGPNKIFVPPKSSDKWNGGTKVSSPKVLHNAKRPTRRTSVQEESEASPARFMSSITDSCVSDVDPDDEANKWGDLDGSSESSPRIQNAKAPVRFVSEQDEPGLPEADSGCSEVSEPNTRNFGATQAIGLSKIPVQEDASLTGTESTTSENGGAGNARLPVRLVSEQEEVDFPEKPMRNLDATNRTASESMYSETSRPGNARIPVRFDSEREEVL